MQIIREEVDQHGIRANRIVLGGFSQGCALSLLAGLSCNFKLAGIISLSGYIPIHHKFLSHVADANRTTPIFWGHGEADQVNQKKGGVEREGGREGSSPSQTDYFVDSALLTENQGGSRNIRVCFLLSPAFFFYFFLL